VTAACLRNAEACLLSMSEFLNSDPHHAVDPLPFFYSLSLSPAPLSGVPAQRPSFAPTARLSSALHWGA
jgi:hypothetical protein